MKKFKETVPMIQYFTILVLAISFAESLYATNERDLIDQLTIALEDHNQAKIQEVSQELIIRGDTIMTAIERGLNSENKLLKGQIIKILGKIKTENSTQMLLNVITEQKDKFIVIEGLQVLQYRDLDLDVNQMTVDKMLKDVNEGNLPSAPLAARILGKMKRVSPQIRTESLLLALQRDIVNQARDIEKKLLPGSYGTEPQYKIRQFVYAIKDVGKAAIPFISNTISKADEDYREYLLICLGLCGEKNAAERLEKILLESEDGHARALSAFALGKLGNNEVVATLKKALTDQFFVTYKSCGKIKEIFPVREEASSSLRKLGILVERQGNIFEIKE